MDEGKPTKAKWWSRVRPQGPSGAAGEDVSSDGDFELARPASAEGDFALAPPVGVGGADSADAVSGGDFELRLPEDEVPTEEPAQVPAAPVSDERPKPLHDPDPYSTPPYGEPGPWAPAPPVQHPATTTPERGTPIPPLSQSSDVQVPPQVPGVQATPQVPGTQAPFTTAAMPAPHPGDGSQVPPQVPGTQDSLPTPAAQAPLPTVGPQAPFTTAAMPAPHPADGPQAAPQAPGTQATPPTHGTPPPPLTDGTPPTQPPPTPAAPATPSAPATPWQNYDPWAAPAVPAAPLQQTGAAVGRVASLRRRVRRALVGGAVSLALLSGVVGGAIGAYLERNGGVGGVELPQAGKEPAGRAADSVAGIAARALPSVVTLHVTGAEEAGTGTGFVLDDLGHILTNNHVVEPAGASGEISVTFNSGDTAKATVVGRDSGYDLAVVKVSGVRGLSPLPLGNSDNVQVGDPVVAIGAPFDLEGTVTSGIISAKSRPITAGDSVDGSDVSYVDALQTDAPINPGNSGGPLLDSRARVIGINSAIRSADDGSDSGSGQAGSIGLGFAIPVNQAKRVAEELINTGRATHPVIGVTLDMDYTGDGARVGTKGSGGAPAVNAGGPGDKAGIKAGDVITEVDGQRVHSGEELIVKTRAHRPGDRLELTVRRDGKELAISLVLGSSDGD